MRHQQISKQTFKIVTQYGDMLVVKQGVHQSQNAAHAHHHALNSSGQSRGQRQQQQEAAAGDQQQGSTSHQSRPIIMTFHDLGLNSELQFASFCECDEVKLMLQTFTMIHVNFIGQEFDGGQTAASSLPDDYKYPSVEQMAECIVDICAQLRVRSFVALAVGTGAYIVSTLALIRPDLVHGLFLINPIVSSCSISEWLYFKMSAIASNHQLLSGAGPHQAPKAATTGKASHSGSLSSADEEHKSPERPHDDKATTHHHHHQSSLRRLWNAVQHHHHHHPQQSATPSPAVIDDDVSKSSPVPDDLEEAQSMADEPPGARQLAHSPSTSSSISSSNQSIGHHSKAAGGRLRHLILSRNFRLGRHSHHERRHHGESYPLESNLAGTGEGHHSSESAPTTMTSALEESDQSESRSASRFVLNRRSSSVSNPMPASSGGLRRASGSSQTSSSSGTGKRPPLEYLMYHHFGTVSFQRLRRLSSDAHTELCEQANQFAAATRSPAIHRPRDSSGASEEQTQKVRELAAATEQQQEHRASYDSSASCQSARAAQQLASSSPNSRGGPLGARQLDKSQESLCKSRRRLQRSSSVCLSANYLASIQSDRQRANYMQTVYKQYFTQINSHNLWLFAQSFVKRKTLNLRKDCGAAAHAAAAAAALGTSICVAFVGLGPTANAIGNSDGRGGGGGSANAEQQVAQSSNDEQAASAHADQQKDQKSTDGTSGAQQTAATSTTNTATAATTTKAPPTAAKEQHALVAGTKVKRTFTCQTLIMCSSVHIHRDRALKLMSLLNPLQATWIKTDQLLVLEEKPEKVCQALRLFLQGIGYSMSTYERRLRLCSAQASVSSADSNGSGPSLNSEQPSSMPQQQ